MGVVEADIRATAYEFYYGFVESSEQIISANVLQPPKLVVIERSLTIVLKHLAIFLVGFASASALFVFFILPKEARDKFEFGRAAGRVDGRFEAADALQKEFGLYDSHGQYRLLFSVKTTDVVSVETNGIRTVRVVP